MAMWREFPLVDTLIWLKYMHSPDSIGLMVPQFYSNYFFGFGVHLLGNVRWQLTSS